ncbi:MAG: glutamate synthase subunit beta, partial [Acidimicrobiales bacterium]
LLRYGIPEFKLEKRHLDRRLAQMRDEGTRFEVGVEVGVDRSAEVLLAEHDAVILAGGATSAHDLPIPGRELGGIHQVMELLVGANRVQEGDLDTASVDATGKDVVIIGGGDTGADCLGTVLRQGAGSVHQLEIMPRPPDGRAAGDPWPTWPTIHRVSSAHEEGGIRRYSVDTREFVGDDEGNVVALRTVEVQPVRREGRLRFEPIEGSEGELPAQLVLLAMGFSGPENGPLLDQFGLELTDRGTVVRDSRWATSADGVYVCGDMGRGQSLIVWAIAEGRACAAAVDQALTGSDELPVPIEPTAEPLR